MSETDLNYFIEEEIKDENGNVIGIQKTYPNIKVEVASEEELNDNQGAE